MHGAIVSLPALIAFWTTGAAKSTSHVVKMMSTPWPSSFAAQADAMAGLLPCVSHVTIFSGRPLTPPRPLTWPTRTFAAARAGLSNGGIAPFESNAQPTTIGLAAADAVAATTTASTAIAASGRNNAASFLLVITPSWVCVTVWVPVSYGRRPGSPGCLLCLDEPVERGVQRNVDPVTFRLAHERAGDQVDLRRPMCFDVFEHRRIVRRAALCGENVHLPRVVVQL